MTATMRTEYEQRLPGLELWNASMQEEHFERVMDMHRHLREQQTRSHDKHMKLQGRMFSKAFDSVVRMAVGDVSGDQGGGSKGDADVPMFMCLYGLIY